MERDRDKERQRISYVPRTFWTSDSLLPGFLSTANVDLSWRILARALHSAPATHPHKAPSSMASQEKGDQNVEIHLEETSRPPIPAGFNP